MKRERFDLALDRLPSSSWQQFEALASAFAVIEYSSLRTLASPSGDQGRDGALHMPGNENGVILQYSVTTSWEVKIRATAKRLSEEFSDVTELIYVTNQIIGPKADGIRRELRRDFNLFLDIWDRSWFLDRVNTHPQREAAAERLAEQVVDPLLAEEGIISTKAHVLTSDEAKAALVYLTLQWQDDIRDKGLTKVCFEAMVRAVLRGTDSDHRLTRAEVHSRIQSILHGTDPATLIPHVDSALLRLTKRSIRHWRRDDEFCLTSDERTRLGERLAELETTDSLLNDKLREILTTHAAVTSIALEHPELLVGRLRRIVETIFLQRGESFATSVMKGEAALVSIDFVKDVVQRDWNLHPDSSSKSVRDIVRSACISMLEEPPIEVQGYLRALADSYTLYAFLKETPDVQSAIVKMFSSGNIWLDTTILLPIIAEELLDIAHRRFTVLLRAARESGLELYVTEGVIEEILTHMTRSLACARPSGQKWEGNAPFLYSIYMMAGRPSGSFADWLTYFRGEALPEEDLAEYLEERFGIRVQGLRDYADQAPVEIRGAIQEIWYEAHTRRRGQMMGLPISPDIIRRLVDHDVENYVGVTQRRREEKAFPFGFTSWWLTLDQTAFRVNAELRTRLSAAPPASPVLSPDFLGNYLSVGPIRRFLAKSTESRLPLMLDISSVEGIPVDLMKVAEAVREENSDLPERLVSRKVRDALNTAKRRMGEIAVGGSTKVQGEMLDAAASEGQRQD